MDITISKKTLIIAAPLLALVLAIITFLAQNGAGQLLGYQTGRQAAITAIEAFYTVNYQDDPDTWAARICAASTEAGCAFIQNIAAPGLWPAFEQAQTGSVAEVIHAQMIEEIIGEGGQPMQIWSLTVEMSSPWPQSIVRESKFTTYALLFQEVDGWKIERLLLDAETEKYQEAGQ